MMDMEILLATTLSLLSFVFSCTIYMYVELLVICVFIINAIKAENK